MVGYFRRAGLRRAATSWPSARAGRSRRSLLATLSAARALDLEPVVIYSVGASMYGANLPGFTFVDMLARLRARRPAAVPRSRPCRPGGAWTTAAGVLFDEAGDTLLAETRRSGLPMVEGATLAERIQRRLRIYDERRGGRPIRCFVNIGGASASFGDTAASLALPQRPGPARPPVLPSSPTRGLVFEFAARGVPVVHLLFVEGLARDNGLPFDPVPLPPIGEGACRSRRSAGLARDEDRDVR